MSKTWKWKCTQCEFAIEVPYGTIPNIDPAIPHAKNGDMVLRVDDFLDITKSCWGVEFLKVG